LLTRYPESAVAATGRERIAGLNEWFAIKEFKNGRFYLRYKAYDSAILVFKDLIANYPRTSVAPEALSELVGAYRRLGYVEDVEEMCGYFRTNYSDSPLLPESCPNPVAAPPAGTSSGD
jgi:outer membrane protein assembly factor BamD (BamD/ComL family)